MALLTELYISTPLKMAFDVEYDKSSHKYNLVVNKKSKAGEDLKKQIEKKNAQTFGVIVSGYDGLARRLNKLIKKRRGLTDGFSAKEKIGLLSAQIDSEIVKSKEQARSGVSHAYEKATKLYESSVNRFNDNYSNFNEANDSKKEKLKTEVVKELNRDYRKQTTVLSRELKGVWGSLQKKWRKVGSRALKLLANINKKGKTSIEVKQTKTDTQALRDLEANAYDKKIKACARRLSNFRGLSKLQGLLKSQKANTEKFIKSIKFSLSQNVGDKDDPLTLVGLKGSPRALKTISNLVKLTPPWLVSGSVTRIIPKSASRMLKYKKSMLKKTIEDLEQHRWKLLESHKKKYAFIRRLGLYIPANSDNTVDENVVHGIVSKLSKNYCELLLASNTFNKSDRVNERLCKRKLFSLPKLPIPGLPIPALPGAAAGIVGGGAGLAAGAMAGMEEREKLRNNIFNIEELLSTQEVRDKLETDNFHRLFMTKIRLKRSVNLVSSITRQFNIRLDAKKDDLMQLLIEQEIY